MHNMINPKISVIVPIYKVEQYLERCLDTIINQTYRNLEIILVDDGSPDGCPQICDKYAQIDKRIKVIHKKNGGVSSARNAALDVLTGGFVAFVDPDDFIEVDMYEKLMAVQKTKLSDIVLCRFNVVENNRVHKLHERNLERFCQLNDLSCIYTYCSMQHDKNLNSLIENVFGVLWRGIYRAGLFKCLRFNEKVLCMEDCLIWDELLKNRNLKVNLVNSYLYNYTIRSSSLTGLDIRASRFESDINYVNAVSSILKDDYYLDLVNGLKFYMYVQFVTKKIIYHAEVDIKQFKDWGNKTCYLANKKYTFGLRLKIKNFLIYHRLYKLLRLYYKLKGK